MRLFVKTLLATVTVASLAACDQDTSKKDDELKPTGEGMPQQTPAPTPGPTAPKPNTPPPAKPGQQPAETPPQAPVTGGQEGEEQGGGESVGAQAFNADSLQVTVEKAANRFNRMALAGATLKTIKTWIEPDYTWARLVYTQNGAEKSTFLACHNHSGNPASLDCHAKTEPGSLEPSDASAAPEEELPPIDL